MSGCFNPKNQQLQVRVLETMINMGRTDDAQKVVDRLLKDDPGDVTATARAIAGNAVRIRRMGDLLAAILRRFMEQ